MRHSMIAGSALLGLALLGLNCDEAGESTDEPVAVTEERLGYEDPSPAPGGLPGGGHDPGGPGSGWAGGWANDPQYAPYIASSGKDPNQGAAEAQRQAHERENAPYHRTDIELHGPEPDSVLRRYMIGSDAWQATCLAFWIVPVMVHTLCNTHARITHNGEEDWSCVKAPLPLP